MKITVTLCLTAIVLALLARGHSLNITITHRIELPKLTARPAPVKTAVNGVGHKPTPQEKR